MLVPVWLELATHVVYVDRGLIARIEQLHLAQVHTPKELHCKRRERCLNEAQGPSDDRSGAAPFLR